MPVTSTPETPRYIAQHTGDNKYDVVRIGPTVISKGLRIEEALALAMALNIESETRMKA
mgnify:CR=1 FL=1